MESHLLVPTCAKAVTRESYITLAVTEATAKVKCVSAPEPVEQPKTYKPCTPSLVLCP